MTFILKYLSYISLTNIESHTNHRGQLNLTLLNNRNCFFSDFLVYIEIY